MDESFKFFLMELPQKFAGTIIRGFGRGHKQVGFATANISTETWTLEIGEESYGVYDGLVYIRGEPARIGVVSIGKNHTFDAQHPTFEVHILDFDEDIYGIEMQVELRTFLRSMMPFKSVEELTKQISLDCEKAREHIQPLLEKK